MPGATTRHAAAQPIGAAVIVPVMRALGGRTVAELKSDCPADAEFLTELELFLVGYDS